jgi:hypothetical protein
MVINARVNRMWDALLKQLSVHVCLDKTSPWVGKQGRYQKQPFVFRTDLSVSVGNSNIKCSISSFCWPVGVGSLGAHLYQVHLCPRNPFLVATGSDMPRAADSKTPAAMLGPIIENEIRS